MMASHKLILPVNQALSYDYIITYDKSLGKVKWQMDQRVEIKQWLKMAKYYQARTEKLIETSCEFG